MDRRQRALQKIQNKRVYLQTAKNAVNRLYNASEANYHIGLNNNNTRRNAAGYKVQKKMFEKSFGLPYQRHSAPFSNENVLTSLYHVALNSRAKRISEILNKQNTNAKMKIFIDGLVNNELRLHPNVFSNFHAPEGAAPVAAAPAAAAPITLANQRAQLDHMNVNALMREINALELPPSSNNNSSVNSTGVVPPPPRSPVNVSLISPYAATLRPAVEGAEESKEDYISNESAAAPVAMSSNRRKFANLKKQLANFNINRERRELEELVASESAAAPAPASAAPAPASAAPAPAPSLFGSIRSLLPFGAPAPAPAATPVTTAPAPAPGILNTVSSYLPSLPKMPWSKGGKRTRRNRKNLKNRSRRRNNRK